jgi:hypothetical protein
MSIAALLTLHACLTDWSNHIRFCHGRIESDQVPVLLFKTRYRNRQRNLVKPNINNNEVFPENYNIYRKDRIDQEGGGVLLAIKKDFISDEVSDMHVDEKSEMIWAKIEIVGSKTLYVSPFYNAKTSNEQGFVAYYDIWF